MQKSTPKVETNRNLENRSPETELARHGFFLHLAVLSSRLLAASSTRWSLVQTGSLAKKDETTPDPIVTTGVVI